MEGQLEAEGQSDLSMGGQSDSAMGGQSALSWTHKDVGDWLARLGHQKYVHMLCVEHQIDGRALLLLNESDLRQPPISIQVLGDVKRLLFDLHRLQREHRPFLESLGLASPALLTSGYHTECSAIHLPPQTWLPNNVASSAVLPDSSDSSSDMENERSQSYHSVTHRSHGIASRLEPEVGKAFLSLAYLFGVTWITAFVMVIVHDRVPDMKKYPPLPDIFLDNVPHIPWAFEMCEITGTVLLAIWLVVLLFHKHRFILLRRFFCLSGTVFLLRCVTMLITSLSVPGTHLQCNPRPYGDVKAKAHQAYLIWKAAGMSIQGVRTCGDYMFSGHTVALTMLNFFITEYTPRRIYFLHTFSWLLNMFGIFFILAAHEHYSIDVFVAFYITSRLFLYYHTLANNRALMHLDSKRTRIWFPLFSYFESHIDGMVPNDYEWPFKPYRICLWVKKMAVKSEEKLRDTARNVVHKSKFHES